MYKGGRRIYHLRYTGKHIGRATHHPGIPSPTVKRVGRRALCASFLA